MTTTAIETIARAFCSGLLAAALLVFGCSGSEPAERTVNVQPGTEKRSDGKPSEHSGPQPTGQAQGQAPDENEGMGNSGKSPETIGTATMEEDGTIVLRLRAQGSGGMVGNGVLRYPPSHERYDYVRDHLGGLKPGQEKLVPPFPE